MRHAAEPSAASRPAARSGRQRRRALGAVAALGIIGTMVLTSGCHTGGQKLITRPTKHSVRSDQLMVLSDFKIPKDHTLIQDLVALRAEVCSSLGLPMEREPTVVVYLFADQLSYRQYLEATYPGLPDRRAYFVGTPRELAVFTYWGDRIQEDLRHEFTHGILHSRLKSVPLWLDEGLAEYFEVIGRTGTVNVEYVQKLGGALANGWRPDIQRLERLEEFSQMQRFDYQEAWAWVHFMLHSTPEAKEALIAYLQDLRENPSPQPLSQRLARDIPSYQSRFTAYVGSLPASGAWVGAL